MATPALSLICYAAPAINYAATERETSDIIGSCSPPFDGRSQN